MKTKKIDAKIQKSTLPGGAYKHDIDCFVSCQSLTYCIREIQQKMQSSTFPKMLQAPNDQRCFELVTFEQEHLICVF